MSVASVLPNNIVRTSVKSELGYFRPSSTTYTEWTRLQLTSFSYPPGGGSKLARRFKYSLITCSRKTQQDESSYTSDGEMISSPLHTESSDLNKSHMVSSLDDLPVEKQGPDNNASSVTTVALCVLTAVAFGVGLGLKEGTGKATEFFAGYLLEQSLSVDNLFVFVLIFKYFKVPLAYQNRVLSYGIAGAIFFRLSIILLGAATLQRFEGVKLLLAAVLLYSSFKPLCEYNKFRLQYFHYEELFAEEEEDSDLSDNFIVKTCRKFIPVTSNYDGNRFITVQDGVRKATPLLLTVAVIELSDIAFAVDSIPAVFGVTQDPFIVFTSNLFAILGLRSLYTLVSGSMSELEYLQPAIGVVLGFVGCKMILDFFGIHVATEVSLGFVATSLGTGVMLSLIKKSD